MQRFLTGAIVAACLTGMFAAPVRAQGQPSYARPSYARDEETIRGRIASFNGAYSLQVRDERGYIDNVELHQGTVINPTGLTLASGMTVTIYGHNRGSVFAANEIDTPYHNVYPVYVAPYPYPYPYWWRR